MEFRTIRDSAVNPRKYVAFCKDPETGYAPLVLKTCICAMKLWVLGF